ncbi:PREDICTED: PLASMODESMATA CALLOSE-BINDING PROTEIN 2-like [Prunus mume]|uniref:PLASMODESMATA CALLOSE-BINDING PROTEIN 2-like n=1 Tax=Prunus mume TaxID=102107 RepID=A0ABM1LL93_PRUMU|nr:PREDICTED: PLASMODESMATA CALLOSE-BINDING PROTEIN 2-like [Prunus mume]
MANSTETALEGLPRLPIISQASKAETSRLTPLSAVAPSRFLPLLKHSRVQVHMPLDTIHEEEPADDINIIVENNLEKAWCVAKPAAPQQALQSALDYACNYADCSPTKKGGSCYDPDRPVHHASFAMNAYYQKMGRNQWNCHFNDTSLISLADPSYNPCCQFVSGGSGPPLPQEKEVLVIASVPESDRKENGI